MALFLESVESTVSAKYNGKDITEMLCEGMALGDEMMALNEAMYKADFIIHQRTRNLSESAQLLQEAGFLGTVWEKTKALVKKVWEWIKATWTKFVAKLSEWSNRIMDRLTGDTKEIRKSSIKKCDIIESLWPKVFAKVESGVDKISASKDNTAISDVEEEVKSLFDDAEEQYKEASKIEGRQTVSKTFAKKVADLGKRMDKLAKDCIKRLEKMEKAIDDDMKQVVKDSKGGAFKEDKPDNKKYYADDTVDQQDTNDLATANKKIAYIRFATALLKAATAKGIEGFSAALTDFAVSMNAANTAEPLSPKYKEE